ncbi:L-dopachrome tautomerase-related protein [Spirosoma areae]
MKQLLRVFKWTLLFIFTILLLFLTWFYSRYGGSGEPFTNVATPARWPQDSLHIVATLPEPPGNLAVSKEGRIFCTYHAEGRPEVKVWELVDGKPVPFPNEQWQSDKNGPVFLDAIFNVRIDANNRLWTLDHGQNGFKTPRLLCFDIDTRQLVTQIDLPKEVAGKGSYAQDMQIDTACAKIYIAELSAFGQTPALVVVDIATKKSRRLLENHISVKVEGNYNVVNKGREMKPAGPLYHFHPAVDPIALDRKNEYLYYGPMSGKTMYRIKLADLNNEQLSPDELAAKVETYATNRGQCDGITMDNANNIYLTDIENGAITVLDSSKKQFTLVSHPKMRWPDGMSFGPDGYVYVADSDIPDMMMKSKGHMRENAPYYLWKFKALAPARAGQ